MEDLEGSEPRLGSSAAEVQAVHTGAATYTDGIYYEYDTLPVVTQSSTENYSTSHKKNDVFNLENDNDKFFKKPSQTDSDFMSFFQISSCSVCQTFLLPKQFST